MKTKHVNVTIYVTLYEGCSESELETELEDLRLRNGEITDVHVEEDEQ